jgi:hypothetical protein
MEDCRTPAHTVILMPHWPDIANAVAKLLPNTIGYPARLVLVAESLPPRFQLVNDEPDLTRLELEISQALTVPSASQGYRRAASSSR